ncbi:MAG TPA: ATP-binding protein [Ideonella sp.]|uniref:sensor histidine kinase n=1 Tax=Ideonella sp. TaxID=1929293 RepID=UPI002CA2A89F|nr:ATP-binding protein [Ideonella sp.]HSI51940.1 ATP-binding protein [Ideonella sp.]
MSDLPSPLPTNTPPKPSLWRMRLWRKQALAFGGLVLLSFVLFGAAEVMFSYREAIKAVTLNQSLLAREVSGSIRGSLNSIQNHVRATASLPWEMPGWLDLQDRRDEFQRILRLEPAVRDLTHHDARGEPDLFVSRLELSSLPGPDTLSFADAARLRWPDGLPPAQGSIDYADGYEPHLLLVTPDPRLGAGTTLARVNLRSLARGLNEVLRSKGLEAYAVDRRGVVVLHADTTLMLAQHQALGAATARPDAPAATARSGLNGRAVVASSFELPELGWRIVIEQPRDVALAPVYDTVLRTLLVTLLASLAAVLLALVLVRRSIAPINALHRGAQALGDGRLDARIEIRTGDELDDLAQQFNTMAGNLQHVYRNMSAMIAEKTRDLELANRHKSEFLTHMSHELRTPLNSVIGFSDVLREEMFGALNDKQKEYANDIHASGEHLLALINDVLDLSKIEAGHMALDLSEVDPSSLLVASANMMRERCMRQGLKLQLQLPDEMAPCTVDARRLRQVVLNLLSNAVKFTPAGGEVTLRAGQNACEGLWVEVSDTGVGIAPEDQATVFEEFRQVGDDVLRKAEGTGLGLPLVRRLVHLHGGEVTLHSAPGQGSTFRFNLPLQPAVAVPALI